MSRDSRTKRTSSLGMFMLVSVLAGLLVAGLAIPAAALVGVSSSAVSTTLTELPTELETPPLPEPTKIYLSDGSLLVELYDEYRQIVPLSQIAPIMQQAQIAIEDDRFYSHGALDLRALIKAVTTYFVSDDGGGGSTLTQQYVKQVLIEKAASDPTLTQEERDAKVEEARARTPARKISEMRMAIALEERLSKDQILENYLNIAYYGAGAYGVEAAARLYYNTTAANLTLAQATMLAGIVQTPSRNPIDDLPGAMERRAIVLDRMVELGLVSEADATAAKAEGFDGTAVKQPDNGCANITDTAYIQVCQYIVDDLLTNEHLGDPNDKKTTMSNLKLGGYTIQTTIDPVKQHAAQEAISSRYYDADPVKSIVIMMQPGTGRVVAAAQNRREYSIGDNTDENLAAGRTAFQYFAPYGDDYHNDEGAQAGSTFKPFVVAAALDSGIPPSTTFYAPATQTFAASVDFGGCNGEVARSWEGPWKVSNASISGTMDMMKAAANSVNTYFAQLEKLATVCASATMAQTLGIVTDPIDTVNPDILAYSRHPAFTLGIAYTSPIYMAVAYSTFAARGVRCDPVVIDSIKDRNGADVPTPNGNCQQVIRPEVADGVNYVLGNAFTYGTASGYAIGDGRPMSGKTGTTEDGHDAWMIGYTPNMTLVSMVGVDNSGYWVNNPWVPDSEGKKSMDGVTLGASGTRMTGISSGDAGPIFEPAMRAAVADLPPDSFTKPTAEILNGRKVTAPSTAGMDAAKAKQTLLDAGYNVVEKQANDNSPAGTLISVQCGYTVGSTCTLNISIGPRAPEPTQQAPSVPSDGPTSVSTAQPTSAPS